MSSKTHRRLKDPSTMTPTAHHWPFPSDDHVIPDDTPEFIQAKARSEEKSLAKKEKNQKKERSM